MKSNQSSKNLISFMILMMLFVLQNAGYAAVPQTISYQGYLTDSGGDPVDTGEGTIDMQFAIYDVSSGGSALWTDMQAVTVNQGVYSVTFSGLGGLSFDAEYYLEVAVDEDASGTIETAEILTPRQPFTAVPYAVNADTVDGLDASDLGDITGVTAGTGLTGGGTSGDVTLSADTTVLQSRVSGTCPTGQSIRVISSTGTVTCEVDNDSGGDITGVSAGIGLTGGGTSGNVTVNADTGYLQRRVSSSCPTGQSIRVISPTGTVTCEVDDTGLTSESDPEVGSNTVNYIPKWNGTELVTGSIYDEPFSVGINTSDPRAQLEIKSHTSSRIYLGTYSGPLDPYMQIVQNTFTQNGHIDVTKGDGSPGNLLLLDSGGNVGIGTDTPTHKLEVMGGVPYHLVYFSNDNNAGGSAKGIFAKGDAQDGGDGLGVGGEFVGIGGNTIGDAYGTLNYATASNVANAYGVYSDATGGSTTGREYAFYGYGDGYFSGDVGIGTDSPAYPLDIAGHARVQGPDGFNSAGETAITYYGDGNHSIKGIYAGGININSFDGASDPITFSFSGSEKMRITNTGSVGIGITGPAEKLHVVGNIYATGSITPGSSRALKENIRELSAEEAITALHGLYPQKFYYKADREDEHVGFIAEDVPELVATKDRKGVSSMDVVAVLTKVVQEQQKTILELKEQNKQISQRMSTLEQKVMLNNSMAMADIK